MGRDWEIFHSACLVLISGGNPFAVSIGPDRLFNPPWTLIPLLPTCLLPSRLGYVLNAVISVAALLAVCRRLGLGWLQCFCVVASPMHVESIFVGNIEWLPLLGVLFAPSVALLLFLTKPQSSIGLAVLLLANQWRDARWKGIAAAVVPSLAVTTISLWLWGFPATLPDRFTPWRVSLFPYSLAIGIPALLAGIWKRDSKLAAFSGPFIAPYSAFHGYLPILLPLRRGWMALTVAALYLYGIITLVIAAR